MYLTYFVFCIVLIMIEPYMQDIDRLENIIMET